MQSYLYRYNLQNSGNEGLQIFDLAGKEIETLVSGIQTAGEHEISWQPEGLPIGIYFYKLTVRNQSVTKRSIKK